MYKSKSVLEKNNIKSIFSSRVKHEVCRLEMEWKILTSQLCKILVYRPSPISIQNVDNYPITKKEDYEDGNSVDTKYDSVFFMSKICQKK